MTVATPTRQRDMPAVDVALFREQGFLIFPSLLSDTECQQLCAETDRSEAERIMPVRLPHHANLVTHPDLMGIADAVMGERAYGFHHLHTARHNAGMKAFPWHHDYEQSPQGERVHTMMHFFIYLTGLNGTIGDLLLLPGSHREVLDRYALSKLGTRDLSGMLVVDDLPAGSVVAIHSALLHARRAMPGGESNPRYFADSSYCQSAGRWPAYKERGDWRAIVALLRTHHAARGGQRQELFGEDCFYDL